MHNDRFLSWQRMASWCMVAAGMMTIIALALLVWHITAMRSLRAEYLGLAEDLPRLRTSIALKEAYLETEQVIGSDARERHEQQATTLVLPDTIDSARVVRTLTETVAVVRGQEPLPVISVTSEEAADGGRDVTLRTRGSFTGLARVLGVLRWGGFLTVGDVIGDRKNEVRTLLEEQAPLALPSLEEFFRLDLLDYASQPDVSEEEYLGDLPSYLAPDVRAFLLDAGLADVRLSLAPVADALRSRRLWPLPFSSLRSVVIEGEDAIITVTFHARSA